jgi:hypothetical protein
MIAVSRVSQFGTVQYWRMFAAVLRVNPSEALVTAWVVPMEMP